MKYLRIVFALIGIILLGLAYWGFKSQLGLSLGQSLMTGALIPAALFCVTLLFYKNPRDSFWLLAIFSGAFLVLLCLGMLKQGGEIAYLIFALLGALVMGCGLVSRLT